MLQFFITPLTVMTLSGILTNIGDVLTFLWTIFGDMLDAVTSNPWLYVTILFGFGSTGIALAFKVIRRARRI